MRIQVVRPIRERNDKSRELDHMVKNWDGILPLTGGSYRNGRNNGKRPRERILVFHSILNGRGESAEQHAILNDSVKRLLVTMKTL